MAVCDYLQKFIRDAKLGETKDEIFVKEIVLPYLSSAIDVATKERPKALSVWLPYFPLP